MVPKQLVRALREKKNKTFVVMAHIHLEGDALGSELALAILLRRLGKRAIVVNEDIAPAEYDFLPGVKAIRHDKDVLPPHDAVALVDCSDISRVGKIARLVKRDRTIFNIDHHISNTRFGSVNWVNAKASSASEMVYELYRAMKIPLRAPEAVCLYTGILVDTGSFRYTTTSARTHRIAADLMEKGVDVYGIYRRIHESMSPQAIKTLGRIIATLKTTPDGKIAWLVVRSAVLKQDPSLVEQTDMIIQFARSLAGVEVAMLFKEIRRNKDVRVNLRSTGRADVNKIAGHFGGGGHAMASGCTLTGPFEQVVNRVVEQARAEVA